MQPTIQPILETERLILRPRTMADLERTAAMNADPEVMRYIAPVGDPMMGAEALAKRSFSHVDKGLGYWTVSRGDGGFLGYVGLIPLREGGEGIEFSYRFEQRHWGQGYAFEAVQRLLDHGFGALGLPEIVILTHPENAASLRLAARLGFTREADRRAWLVGDPQFLCAFLRLTRAGRLAGSAAPASPISG